MIVEYFEILTESQAKHLAEKELMFLVKLFNPVNFENELNQLFMTFYFENMIFLLADLH